MRGAMAEPRYDVIDEDDGMELARAVTVKVASELTGLRVTTIETRVAADGEVLVTGLAPEGGLQRLIVRPSAEGA